MATKSNIIIDQGSTYSLWIDLLDSNNAALDVTGYTANAQIRKYYSSNLIENFTTSLSDGVLILSLTSTQTANIESGRYVYDVELIDDANSTIRILEGVVTITPEVTR